MRVDGYKNLNRGTWSVRDAKTPYHVLAHPLVVLLRDVTFVVQPGGLARVRREQQRAVHAWCRGEWVKGKQTVCGKWRAFRYNPYKFDTFVFTDTEKPVLTAEWVLLDEEGQYCIPHDHGSLASALATPDHTACVRVSGRSSAGTLPPGHPAHEWNG